MTNNTKKFIESKIKLKIVKNRIINSQKNIPLKNKDMLIKTDKKWSIYVFFEKICRSIKQFLRIK